MESQPKGTLSYQAALRELLADGGVVVASSEGEVAPMGNHRSMRSKLPAQATEFVTGTSPTEPTLFANRAFWLLIAGRTGALLVAISFMLLSSPVILQLILPKTLPATLLRKDPVVSTLEPAPDVGVALKTARAFLLASGNDERSLLVRSPEVVRPFLEHWSPWRIRPSDLELEKPVRYTSGKGDYYLLPVVDTATSLKMPVFLEYREVEGFKVDWASTVSFQPMPWKTFVRTRPTEPLPFRVVVEKHDWYPKGADARAMYEVVEDPALEDGPHRLRILMEKKDREFFSRMR